jgi:hypothetical protein
MWVNLGADAVRHLRAQRHRLAHVERYLATCSVPDEALLPSLLLNDAEHLDVVNDRKRYIRWIEGSKHPEMLTMADVQPAVTSGDFFARKVDPQASADVLDELDRLHSGQEPSTRG